MAEGALDLLWRQRFEAPGGEAVAMSTWQGRKLVLNFWATWCPPCVEELPMLDAFFRAQQSRGWHVVGLAVDQPAAVRQFLKKLPLGFPVGVAGLEGMALAKTLGNATGGLPFTVVIDAQGQIVQRKLGKVTEADLALWGRLP
jgi:thiol-disulfide isomerase/thioredoxin